jgi:TonB family protein
MLLKTKQTQLAGWKYLLAAPLIGGMILLSGMTSSLLAQVQNKKEKVKETTVGQEKKIEAKEHVKIDEPPMFQGGNMEGFSKWIGENIKYPQKAIDENITGKVYVSFEIITTGEVMNVSVARSANPLLDEEAVRVIKSSPKWKPAQIDGKPASIKMIIPVGFTLDEKKK